MPDVIVSATIRADNFRRTIFSYVVGIDTNIQYAFYTNIGMDFAFVKSIDGGNTWSAETIIQGNSVVKSAVWYDRWTPGDTGIFIHILTLDSTGPNLSYFSLDTTDDTVSAEVVIDNPVVVGVAVQSNQVTIAKARGGNLLVQFWGDAAGSRGVWRSIDNGVSWVARADGADGNTADYVMMFPGNEADDNDFWMLYLDISVNELSLKTYDDSGDSWSEALIVTGIVESATVWSMGGAIRHSDNHLLVAVWTAIDNATAGILTFDINGAPSITPMANVVTDLAESGVLSITFSQGHEDVYVGYLKGGVFGATVDVVYKLSTDGMVVWGSEQAMSEDAADNLQQLASTLSVSSDGGLFLPIWANLTPDDYLCNVNNAVSIDPFVPPEDALAEYGQRRAAIGQPSVYGATIVRS